VFDACTSGAQTLKTRAQCVVAVQMRHGGSDAITSKTNRAFLS
jgi:hypothetical protein